MAALGEIRQIGDGIRDDRGGDQIGTRGDHTERGETPGRRADDRGVRWRSPALR